MIDIDVTIRTATIKGQTYLLQEDVVNLIRMYAVQTDGQNKINLMKITDVLKNFKPET